jgi:4-hydroxyproline epimerase
MADYAAGDLIAWSPVVRKRLNEKYTFEHPENPAINRLSHMLWTGAPKHPEADARNAVFYGDKAIDRSPCGTGTSARMAQLHAKGKLAEASPSCMNRSSVRCSRAASNVRRR